jgi:hypothetical protein
LIKNKKMRGYKRVVVYLPHEVADLEPVLALLARQDPTDSATWQTRYMLLLWLSIIAMIPFDMSRFDAAAKHTNENQQHGVMDRLLATVVVSNLSLKKIYNI